MLCHTTQNNADTITNTSIHLSHIIFKTESKLIQLQAIWIKETNKRKIKNKKTNSVNKQVDTPRTKKIISQEI